MIFDTINLDKSVIETGLFEYGRKEMHVVIHVNASLCYDSQVSAIHEAVSVINQRYLGMSPVFRRIFLSDIHNQNTTELDDSTIPTSYIQQAPLDGSKVALWMVWQEGADFRESGEGLWEDSHGNLIFTDTNDCQGNSFVLTINNLEYVAEELRKRDSSLLDNCIRTWFMVHDVDYNYPGVVHGRNEVFRREGLTTETHFISSTGIGGTPRSLGRSVAFNAICNTTLMEGQMNFLYGASHLNPTIEYGVAFERGTTVDFGDRRHVYISGTASIDNNGKIVHPGDIKAQTERMLENISVLLEEASCDVEDIAHLLVYLRDISDYETVEKIFKQRLPGIPRVILHAPVCRPGWLVETECMAIRKRVDSRFSDY